MFLVHILAVLIVGVAIGAVLTVHLAIRLEANHKETPKPACPNCRFIREVTDHHTKKVGPNPFV